MTNEPRARLGWLLAFGMLPLACSTEVGGKDPIESSSQAMTPGQCLLAQPKDILVASLVKDSFIAAYPLTRLSVDASGMIRGPNLPDLLAGDLEVINSVTAARDSVARAVTKIAGLPDYGTNGLGPDTEACAAVAAWTPSGTTTVATLSNQVFTNGTNEDSWRKVHMEFGKECPLIKRLANRDIVDPAGDGSTTLAPSLTVSATGVTANAFGLCPAGTPVGTYCKLSYATGINYTGRTCQYYYGSLRCLLY